MGISEDIILVLFLSVSMGSQIPSCQDQTGIIFTVEPADVEIGCGTDEFAIFACRYNGTLAQPQWIINSTVYSPLNSLLPLDHSYFNHELFVRSGIQINNTLYQCQLLTLSNKGSLCAYRSSIGRLIVKCIKALDVNCTPHYLFLQRSSMDFLTGISTIITQPDGFDDSFSITYTDSLCGRRCDSAIIPSSSCVDRLCRHEFNVSSSLSCLNAIAINVIVTSIVHPDMYKSELITIDFFNTFVRVSFEVSTLNLDFINQPKEGEKFYSIMYGPVTQDCKHLPSIIDGHLSDTNSLSLQLSHMESSSFCFILVVSNGTNSVSVKGIYADALLDNNTSYDKSLITAITVFVVGLIIVANAAIITGMYRHFTTREYTVIRKNTYENKEEETEGELDDSYMYRSTEAKKEQSPIDISTTYFKLLDVTNECLMYEFGMKHFPGYEPDDGYGYVKKCDSLNFIPPHNKMIVMDEGLPKFIAFTSAMKQTSSDIHDVYEQNRSFTMKLTPGSSFLYCAFSKDITATAFWKMYDVSKKCKESEFAEKKIPRYTADWSRYCYFEFTKAEFIKPHQHIIVLMKNGKLVTGPGVRRLIGATGDGSKMTHPSKFSREWDRVFIQSGVVDRELIPGTKYLFCATVDRVRAHYSIYNIHKKCNMAEFGRRHIPGFKPERGYGYYEFTQDEYFKPHKKVILVHKDNRLFTGGGAQFICAGDDNYMEAILRRNKITPPDLTKTEWKHVFIQSHSNKRELFPGTKFLYCEYKMYK